MRPAAWTSAAIALCLLAGGMLAMLRIGGTLADVGGLLAVVVGLVAFCRAAFRLAEGPTPPPVRGSGSTAVR